MDTTETDYSRKPRAFATAGMATLGLKLFGALTGILAARLLGPTGRGELAAATAIPYLLTGIAPLGLPLATLYCLREGTVSKEAILQSAFKLALATSVALTALGAVAIVFTTSEQYRSLIGLALITLTTIPLSATTQVLSQLDLTLGRSLRFYWFQTLPALLYCTMLLFSSFQNSATVAYFVLSLCLAHAATALCRGASMSARFWTTETTATHYSALARTAVKYFTPTLFTIVICRLDLLLLPYVCGARDLGLYTAALAVAAGQASLSSNFSQLAFFDIAGSSSKSTALATHAKAAQLTIGTALVLSLVVGPPILRWGMGPDFRQATVLLVPLTILMAFRNASDVAGTLLRASGKSLALTKATFLQMIGLLVSFPFAAQHGGLEMAAVVLLIAEIVFCCWAIVQVCQVQHTTYKMLLIDRTFVLTFARALFAKPVRAD